MKAYVDLAMLRAHLGDKVSTIATSRGGDLVWDDQELTDAMESAARSYNSIPPLISSIRDATRLPAHDNTFLDGAAAAAMRQRVVRLTAERQAFQAGGITTDPDGVVIDGLTKLADTYTKSFREAAQIVKANRNHNMAYGRVG